MLVALLALAGLFLSLYLTLFKLGYIGHLACAAGSCERVQTSQWSVLMGVPVAAWGVAFYLAVLSVAVASTQPSLADSLVVSRLLAAMSAGGVLFSAYLTGLELFVIHATCMYCLASAIIVTAMLGLSLAEMRRARE
jgi:uncharacterized membrane protein